MAQSAASPAKVKAPVATKTAPQVVRTRLVTRDSLALSTPSARRVALHLLELAEKVRFRDDADVWETALQAFNKEVALLEHTTRTKCASVKHRCEQERAAYATVHAEIDQSVAQARADIEKLTEQLADAKRERAHREQYEALARVINEHPDRAATLREIGSLDQELVTLDKRRDATDAGLSLRTKQFQLLLHTVWDLQQQLEEEEAEQAAAAAAEAAALAEATNGADDVDMAGGADEDGAVSDHADDGDGLDDDDDDDDDFGGTRGRRETESSKPRAQAGDDGGEEGGEDGEVGDVSDTPRPSENRGSGSGSGNGEQATPADGDGDVAMQ